MHRVLSRFLHALFTDQKTQPTPEDKLVALLAIDTLQLYGLPCTKAAFVPCRLDTAAMAHVQDPHSTPPVPAQPTPPHPTLGFVLSTHMLHGHMLRLWWKKKDNFTMDGAGKLRSADCVAEGRVQVVVINKKDFMDLDNPLLAWMLDSDAVTTVLRVPASPPAHTSHSHPLVQHLFTLASMHPSNPPSCTHPILLQVIHTPSFIQPCMPSWLVRCFVHSCLHAARMC